MNANYIADQTSDVFLKGTRPLPALFKVIGANQRDFEKIARVEAVCAGEIVNADGQSAGRIGYVLDGMLAITKTLPDGRSNILGVLGPNDMYGRAFDDGAFCQIKALTDSRIYSLERAAFEGILKQNSAVERLLLLNVLDEIDAAREWILLLGCHRVIERVASYLLILCRRKMRMAESQKQNPAGVKVVIRRSDLAHYLGARVESLSRAFHELEARGALRIVDANNFDIIDMNILIEIGNHDIA
jgi:CRP/FNR family transcriptional regulator